MAAKEMSFAYQTLLLGPWGSWVACLNCWRLAPCKWSRCQSSINQHLREPTSVADIVTEASLMLPHPPGGNCKTVADPSVGCFVKKRLQLAIVMGGRLWSYSAFVGKFYHLISTFTSDWLSAVGRKSAPPRAFPSVCCRLEPCLYSVVNILVVD